MCVKIGGVWAKKGGVLLALGPTLQASRFSLAAVPSPTIDFKLQPQPWQVTNSPHRPTTHPPSSLQVLNIDPDFLPWLSIG